MVEAGKAPFGDAGTTGQRELLQRVGQWVEAAETPVVHMGAALQRQGLELLQEEEVVQALVVDFTVTGIHSFDRHFPEIPELWREMAILIGPDPLLVSKP